MTRLKDMLQLYLVDVASVSHRIEKISITSKGFEIEADGDLYQFDEETFIELIFVGHTADWKYNLSDH